MIKKSKWEIINKDAIHEAKDDPIYMLQIITANGTRVGKYLLWGYFSIFWLF
jgi:hypothetical protein